ncbi:hypothetical protein Syun_027717 [Stephania yunnanensis]|uniref:RRM domain-containing protein n=1 Tax=Stephania yunnanensis TaxID=152371 RepID=A0AAP0HQG9_9MAGN
MDNECTAVDGGLLKPDVVEGTDDEVPYFVFCGFDGWRVLERLKNLGVEQIEEIYLLDNPNKEGKSMGYALLEFSTHSDAMSRISTLKQPDMLFWRDRSAKVAFSRCRFILVKKHFYRLVVVKANLAKPRYKGRIGKKGAKGGYKVQDGWSKDKIVEASKMKGNNISKRPQGKGKGVANKQNDRWNKSHYPGRSGKQNDKGVSV